MFVEPMLSVGFACRRKANPRVYSVVGGYGNQKFLQQPDPDSCSPHIDERTPHQYDLYAHQPGKMFRCFDGRSPFHV